MEAATWLPNFAELTLSPCVRNGSIADISVEAFRAAADSPLRAVMPLRNWRGANFP